MQADIIDIIKQATIVAAAAMATATIVAADIVYAISDTRCPCDYHTNPRILPPIQEIHRSHLSTYRLKDRR